MRLTSGRLLLGSASAGAFGLLLQTAFSEPVAPGVVAASAFAYLALVTAGALVPGLEMYGDILCRGPDGGRRVALTFDDGPHPDTTRRILEGLREGGARATFFVIGEKAERHPDVVSAIAAAGHTIGIHGHTHDRLYAFKTPASVYEDVERACGVVSRITGNRPAWFRPPLGQVSPRVAEGARRAKVRLAGWSCRTRDGIGSTSADQVVRRAVSGLTPGAILLMHDAAERDDRVPASTVALPRVLAAARERGLDAVTLDELVEGTR